MCLKLVYLLEPGELKDGRQISAVISRSNLWNTALQTCWIQLAFCPKKGGTTVSGRETTKSDEDPTSPTSNPFSCYPLGISLPSILNLHLSKCAGDHPYIGWNDTGWRAHVTCLPCKGKRQYLQFSWFSAKIGFWHRKMYSFTSFYSVRSSNTITWKTAWVQTAVSAKLYGSTEVHSNKCNSFDYFTETNSSIWQILPFTSVWLTVSETYCSLPLWKYSFPQR